MIDMGAVRQRIKQAVNHYEHSAPTVAEYLNRLYIRINEEPAGVRLPELLFVSRLNEDFLWMHPNYAANTLYHMMHRLGMSTVGHAGF